MNIRLVLNIIGSLLILVSCSMLISTGIAYFSNGEDFIPFVISNSISFVLGFILKYLIKPANNQTSYREAFAISVFAWLSIAIISSLPMFITDSFGFHAIHHVEGEHFSIFSSYTNSFFESMSGLTATAATVVTDIEGLPKGISFWRCFQNWLGGMGIVVLFVAILPSLGAGGFKLFRAEVSFSVSESDNTIPKIADMARVLWLTYLGLSFCLAVLLYFLGMNLFDSLCHTFSAMSTGGFSTKNNSIAYFDHIGIEIVLMIFMFVAGMNFMIVRQLIRGNLKVVFINSELKFYTAFIFICILLVTLVNYFHAIPGTNSNTILSSLRYAAFQVISLGTSTGLGNSDFNIWPAFSQIIIILCMLMGGCGGSTAGGMKVIRVLIFFKWMQREIKRLLSPHGVFPVVLRNQAIDTKSADAAIGFVAMYFIILLGLGLLVSFFENDMTIAFSSVLACLSNMGPGFGKVGPLGNFFELLNPSKWILSFSMLIGRLEILAFLILFNPNTWKK